MNRVFYRWMTLCLSMLLIGLASCIDEYAGDSLSVEEGKPVTVQLGFSVPQMTEVNTRLTPAQEYHINDLYILIFDAQQNRKFGQYYTREELTAHQDYPNFDGSEGGSLTITTTSGESYIYGVANVETNELEALKAKLDAVQSVTDLQAITASLKSAGNIERNQASLVMSGTFEGTDATDAQKAAGYCVLPADGSSSIALSGRIHLKRLDSHITFKIQTDNNSAITSFSPTSWRVYNVPVKSYLVAQAVDAVTASSSDYTDATERIDFAHTDNNTYSFDFYMLENRKNGLNNITQYDQREVEKKETVTDSDKPGQTERNTGEYKNVEPYATFVEIKAKMTIQLEDGQVRFADVRYVIHLGYVNNVASDFKSERNTRYIYTVKVQDVNNIVLEVESKQETQPGAEGDVVDAQEKLIQLDCHYHTFVLGFTKASMQNFEFQVQTPFTTYTDKSTGISGEDLTWIEFKRNVTNKPDRLEAHKNDIDRDGTKRNLLTLFQLKEDVLNTSLGENETVYYTVFIKEYFYDEPPVGQLWNKPYWPYFVNQPDRYVMLGFTPRYSSDGDSSYTKGSYYIGQRSIQTFYSTTNLTPSMTALGVEHYNETGQPPTNGKNYGTDESNGYNNAVKRLNPSGSSTDKWVNYLDGNSGEQGNLTFAVEPNMYTTKSKHTDVIIECLTRNRDENGDGYIDASEIKWYVPGIKQYVSVALGSEALVTPLFNSSEVESIGNAGDYHYLASNESMLWAEELCSTGAWDIDGKASNGANKPKEIRCVRNLADSPATNPDPVYKVDGQTISLPYLNPLCKRESPIERGELPFHDNFSRTNLPYESFTVAKGTAKQATNWRDYFVNQRGGTLFSSMTDFVTNWVDKSVVSVASTYYENWNRADQGIWRMPNQRELAYMFIINKAWCIDNGGEYSITHWKYTDTNRPSVGWAHFGVSSGTNLFLDQGDRSTGKDGNSSLRPVHDTKE